MKTRRCWVLQKCPWPTPTDVRCAKKAAPAARQPEGKADAAPTAGYAPRVASKTAAKNAQRAAARKAKERAEKEEKLRQKNAPKKKKKKKGGH